MLLVLLKTNPLWRNTVQMCSLVCMAAPTKVPSPPATHGRLWPSTGCYLFQSQCSVLASYLGKSCMSLIVLRHFLCGFFSDILLFSLGFQIIKMWIIIFMPPPFFNSRSHDWKFFKKCKILYNCQLISLQNYLYNKPYFFRSFNICDDIKLASTN